MSNIQEATAEFTRSKYGIELDTLKPDYKLSNGNSKLAKDGIVSFNLIPIVHCPLAGACKQYCYATAGMQAFRASVLKRARAFLATLREDFVDVMVKQIAKSKASKVRIHDSGDFYSAEYLLKWIRIAELSPTKQFYAYTKMIPLVAKMQGKLPSNLKLIQSLGGIADSRIDMQLPHARIFRTRDELLTAGYSDASDTDLPASQPGVNLIGLVIHGAKSSKFNIAVK